MKQLLDYWVREGIIKNSEVLEAFKSIDRVLFVPDRLREEAYLDVPLPIPEGQTISQPTTVAIMTESLMLGKGMKILEVGAGTGYQAAIIGKIIGPKGRVLTIEYDSELARLARENLSKTPVSNVEVIVGDGGLGFPQEAPYDRIILTCAAADFPPPLLDQLKPNGIILAPLGSKFQQWLIRGIKGKSGIVRENLGGFLFVPLRGRYG